MTSLFPSEIKKAARQFKLVAANIYIFSVFILWTVLALIFSPLAIIIFYVACGSLPKAGRQAIWLYARLTMFLLSPCVKVTSNDFNLVKNSHPCILVVNHLSFLDLFLFAVQAQSNLCMVAKGWPFKKLFFFFPVMRLAQYLNIENMPLEDIKAWCHKLLKDGVTVIVFPEGRRSRDGKLGRFYSGAFSLAVESGVQVVPMVITGSDHIFKVGAKYFTPGTINLQFLPPVKPEDFSQALLPNRAMLRYVRNKFIENLVKEKNYEI